MSEFKFSTPDQAHEVSAIFESPPKAKALLVLAHGAGAGMNHSGMASIATALHSVGIATLRFQFPYMERGSKRPDSAPIATATIAAAVKKASELAPKLPLFAGGKSFGGRMTTTAASLKLLPEVQGIICFGFPLHPAKQPSLTRAAHLAEVKTPMLFIQGTRDDLADLSLIKKVAKKYPELIKIHIIEGADHSFGVLKSSGRKPEEVTAEIAAAVVGFVKG